MKELSRKDLGIIEEKNWIGIRDRCKTFFSKSSPPSPSPQTGEKDGLPRVFLEMLNYPENKPSESGTYHVVVSDGVSSWPSVAMWTLGFWEIINTKDEDYEVFAFLQRIAHQPPPAQSDQEAAKKWISDHGVKFMAIEQQRNAFLAGCTRVRAQQGEITKQLQEIRAAFQWTFDNMNTPHTSDHFNVPANGIAQIDQLLTLFSSQTKQP